MFPRQSGATWLAPLWAELTGRAAALHFRADHADAHAAPLFLLAARWAEACEAVLRIASWRRIPAPLCWMAEARYRLDGLDAASPLLVELAWLSPSRFDQLLSRLGDACIHTLRRNFDTSFDGAGDIDDLAWFPAWILTEKAGLAPLFKQAEPSRPNAPERAAKVMLQLLTRAARDFAQRKPEFAMACGRAALHWMAAGFGYEITGSEVLDAYGALADAAVATGMERDELDRRLREQFAATPGHSFVATVLAHHLST